MTTRYTNSLTYLLTYVVCPTVGLRIGWSPFEPPTRHSYYSTWTIACLIDRFSNLFTRANHIQTLNTSFYLSHVKYAVYVVRFAKDVEHW